MPIKNPLLLVTAFAELKKRLPDCKSPLIVIGGGPLVTKARCQADACGCSERLSLVGRRSPAEVARYLQAADVLCVPSANEGVPNVILEAFATALPVVAMRVGGIPEVLSQNSLAGC